MQTLSLASDPAAALATARETSRAHPVLLFKKSPICPTSHRAEREFERWLATLDDGAALAVAVIDVIAERPLARGLTTALGIAHESPQALWFEDGELAWHGSHGQLDEARFAELFATAAGG